MLFKFFLLDRVAGVYWTENELVRVKVSVEVTVFGVLALDSEESTNFVLVFSELTLFPFNSSF